MKRISWIDLLRGLSIMAILWFHTEVYYAGSDVTPYVFYVGNVLAVFFFISGYLFKSSKPFDSKFLPLLPMPSIVGYHFL